MNEPVEVRNEQMRTGAPAVPPATPIVPPATTTVAMSRSTVMPYGYKVRQFVWLAVTVVDLFLALRFALLAAGAGDSGFTSIVYTVGGALAWPFQGVLGVTVTSGHPLQWVDVLAIAVYTAAAWIVAKLAQIASTPSDRSASVYGSSH